MPRPVLLRSFSKAFTAHARLGDDAQLPNQLDTAGTVLCMWEVHAKSAALGILQGSYLHPCAALLPNVVTVHDVQDLIPDGLGVAPPANTAQHTPHPLLGCTSCPAMRLHSQVSN